MVHKDIDEAGRERMTEERKRVSDIFASYYETLRLGYANLAVEHEERVRRWVCVQADRLAEALGEDYEVGEKTTWPPMVVDYSNLSTALSPAIAFPTWDLRDGEMVRPGRLSDHPHV